MKERKSPRLKEYDYSIPNYYFVTICTQDKQNLFGDLASGEVVLNKNGMVVKECLLETKEHFTDVEIDEYVIMPDHFHAIIILQNHVGLRSPQPINNDQPKKNADSKTNEQSEIKTEHFSLSQVIAYFKYQSTKKINEGATAKEKVWQISFYDRIIRNERELYNIRNYIRRNPLKKHLEIVGNLDL